LFTSVHKRQFLHHRNDIATATAVIATPAAEIRLSYVIINIVIIEMKTKAAFKSS
jgi:hypothetical protein